MFCWAFTEYGAALQINCAFERLTFLICSYRSFLKQAKKKKTKVLTFTTTHVKAGTKADSKLANPPRKKQIPNPLPIISKNGKYEGQGTGGRKKQKTQ